MYNYCGRLSRDHDKGLTY